MYTENTVQLHCGAFLLTLLVAAVPVTRAVCELACPQPPAGSVSTCHDASMDRDATAMRSQSHACGDTHVDSLPAILTADNARGHAESFTAFPAFSQVRVQATAPVALSALAAHGPPGSVPLRAVILSTILRI